MTHPQQQLIAQLRRAIKYAYSGSAEHGAFLRGGGGEYVPSPFMLLDELEAALSAGAVPQQEPQEQPLCPVCGSTDLATNGWCITCKYGDSPYH